MTSVQPEGPPPRSSSPARYWTASGLAGSRSRIRGASESQRARAWAGRSRSPRHWPSSSPGRRTRSPVRSGSSSGAQNQLGPKDRAFPAGSEMPRSRAKASQEAGRRSGLAMTGCRGSGSRRFTKYGGVMALAPKPVGPEAEGMLQPRSGAAVPRGEPGGFQGFDFKFRVTGQESGHSALVLLRGEGAGGIDQTTTGGQKRRGRIQDSRLPPRAHLHQLRAPVGQSGGLLPEHPLPGTGGVHQHPVKPAGKPLGQALWGLLEHQGVGDGHALHILGQDFGAFWVILVAHQQPLPLHLSRQLGGLAPGGGAQIQDPLTRLHAQQLRRSHGAGLLEIVQSRLVPGVQARPRFWRVPEAVSGPGQGGNGKG